MTNDDSTKSTGAQASSKASLLSVSRLAAALDEFALRRDWAQFHSPKNLAMALTGEVGELVEVFQWMSDEQSRRATEDPATKERIEHELADVLLYLVRLADVAGIDLDKAAQSKLALNERKYPVATSKGNSMKYDQLPKV